MDKILIKRGTKEKLEKSSPLSQGELFLAKDEERLYVGGPKGNISIPTQKEVDEITAQLAQTAYKTDGIVSVLQFGAVGDGETDDTEAIRLADAEASKEGKTVYFPSGYCFRTTDTIYFSTNVNVKMDSPIIFDSTEPKPAIVYGSKNTTILHKDSKFWAVKKTISNWLDYSTTNLDDTMFVGVKLINIGMSRLEIVQANNFTIGVECLAHKAGFYFNSIYIGQIRNNRSGIEIVTENNGWPNGNDFYGGSFTIGSNINRSIPRKYISSVIRSGEYGSNTNVFHNPKLEGGTDIEDGVEFIPIQLQKANAWRIYDVRGENFAKTGIVKLDNSSDNIISFRVKWLTYGSPDKIEMNGSTNNHVYVSHKRDDFIEKTVNKSLVFDSGLIKDQIYKNDADPHSHPAVIGNMLYYDRASKTYTGGKRITRSGFPQNVFDEYGGTATSQYFTPGVRIDTSVAKRFVVENQESGWRVSIGLFDENGNVLSGEENISKLKGTGAGFYANNWYYHYSMPITDPLCEFSVAEDVKSIVIMVSGYTKRWKVYSLDYQSRVIEPEIKALPKLYLFGEDMNIYQISVDSAGKLKATLVTE